MSNRTQIDAKARENWPKVLNVKCNRNLWEILMSTNLRIWMISGKGKRHCPKKLKIPPRINLNHQENGSSGYLTVVVRRNDNSCLWMLIQCKYVNQKTNKYCQFHVGVGGITIILKILSTSSLPVFNRYFSYCRISLLISPNVTLVFGIWHLNTVY